jgi:hypothetical protein
VELGKWKNEPLTPEQLHTALTESWERDAAKEFIPWKTPDDEAIAREQAWAMLEVYFAQCPVAPEEHPEGVEVEVECSLGAGLPPLYGIIDSGATTRTDHRLQVGGPQSQRRNGRPPARHPARLLRPALPQCHR